MRLLVFGLGYSGLAVLREAADAGIAASVTTRRPLADASALLGGLATAIAFDAADEAIAQASHVLATAAPGEGGDPILERYRAALASASDLVWAGYLSTTGVYGDRGGGRVDETTAPDPGSARARRRIDAERGWAGLAGARRAVDLIRLAGIYGPGRSVFEDLRRGTSRPIRAPGHRFGRIHRDDIAGGVLAAIATADPTAAPVRVLNFSDDEPAESADVIAHAAGLLGLPAPAERSLAAAWPEMSAMARSFWSDDRTVASELTQRALGRTWRHPTYREGLRAILLEEGAQRR